jgi:hypothetical protein
MPRPPPVTSACGVCGVAGMCGFLHEIGSANIF